MKIDVQNSPPGLKSWIKRAANFYGQHLFSRQLRPHLTLRFKFDDIPQPKDPASDEVEIVHALCGTGDKTNSRGRPRDFDVTFHSDLAKFGQLELLFKVVAHEMTHIRQYAYGELDDQMTVWKGTAINGDAIPYAEHPWELEADAKEAELYDIFYNTNEDVHLVLMLDDLTAETENHE